MAASARAYDIVVFGASGFTGKFVAQLLDRNGCAQKYRIAVAGRSTEKLLEVLSTLQNRSSFSTIVANVDDEASLVRMCAQAVVLLNCVGPYRFHGEAVVKACIAGGAHYLDITGEPEFMERMEARYSAAAKEKNLVIVSACGFDSIPADLGNLFTVAQFPPASVPVTVDSFLALDSGGLGITGHLTTFECAVHGVGSQRDLSALRKAKAAQPVVVPGPKPKKHAGLFFAKDVGKYALPFPGSDASVVRRSQQYFATAPAATGRAAPPPVHYSAYFNVSSFFWACAFIVFGGLFGFLARFPLGRKLLLKYPGIFTLGMFSHAGPNAEQLRRAKFSMTFIARGYARAPPSYTQLPALDSKIVTRVSGPEPGYVATPIFLVESARCVLEEHASVPRGVLTTASAFASTSLIDRLKASGIQFEVLSSTFKE